MTMRNTCNYAESSTPQQ